MSELQGSQKQLNDLKQEFDEAYRESVDALVFFAKFATEESMQNHLDELVCYGNRLRFQKSIESDEFRRYGTTWKTDRNEVECLMIKGDSKPSRRLIKLCISAAGHVPKGLLPHKPVHKFSGILSEKHLDRVVDWIQFVFEQLMNLGHYESFESIGDAAKGYRCTYFDMNAFSACSIAIDSLLNSADESVTKRMFSKKEFDSVYGPWGCKIKTLRNEGLAPPQDKKGSNNRHLWKFSTMLPVLVDRWPDIGFPKTLDDFLDVLNSQ